MLRAIFPGIPGQPCPAARGRRTPVSDHLSHEGMR